MFRVQSLGLLLVRSIKLPLGTSFSICKLKMINIWNVANLQEIMLQHRCTLHGCKVGWNRTEVRCPLPFCLQDRVWTIECQKKFLTEPEIGNMHPPIDLTVLWVSQNILSKATLLRIYNYSYNSI